MQGGQRGSVLIRLAMLAALLAIAATWLARTPPPSVLLANEQAAVNTLRTLARAQMRLRNLGAIDCDGDSRGEFGYFGELSGSSPLRIDEFGRVGARMLHPALLRQPWFRAVQSSMVTHQGYHYWIFLPDVACAGVVEAPTGGASGNCISAAHAERHWCCYAWPVSQGVTGKHAYFINEKGVVLQSDGSALNYSGYNLVPAVSSAYLGVTSGTMDCSLAANNIGTDCNRWALVR